VVWRRVFIATVKRLGKVAYQISQTPQVWLDYQVRRCGSQPAVVTAGFRLNDDELFTIHCYQTILSARLVLNQGN
jgi:hypothetical protein